MLLTSGPNISLPQGITTNVQLLLRWVHFAAGITWIGLLYFFTLVSPSSLQQMDAPTRSKVMSTLMLRALWWFRWASVVTVLAGITYWMMIVTADAHNAQTGGGNAIGSFFLIWTAVFVIEMGLLMSPTEVFRKGPVFGTVIGLLVAGAAWLYLSYNSDGWESNRLLAIGIGGGIGWFMMLNVWGIVWRAQKKIIRWTADNAANGTPIPAEAAQLTRLSMLAARTNFVMSFPMLLMMAVASHYPVFGP